MNIKEDPLRVVLQINEAARRLYKEQLQNSAIAQDYLKKRHIPQHIIELVSLGYADNNNSLVKLLSANYSTDILTATDLVKLDNNKEQQDFFADGIVLPWQDHYQRSIGFTLRSLNNTSDYDKYATTLRSQVFREQALFYGSAVAYPAILEKGFCLLTEGHWDVLALFACGFYNSLCTGGASFFPQHGQQLSMLTKKVILLFDQDEGGRHATEKAKIILSKYGVETIVPSYNRKDIAEVYEQDGLAAVQKIIGATNVVC